MNKYLLDTSTCSLLMQDNSRVKGRLDSLTESDYHFTCPIVKGEIFFGIVRLPDGKRRQDLEQKANELFADVPCDPIPESVSDAYAEIKVAAEQQGTSHTRIQRKTTHLRPPSHRPLPPTRTRRNPLLQSDQ